MILNLERRSPAEAKVHGIFDREVRHGHHRSLAYIKESVQSINNQSINRDLGHVVADFGKRCGIHKQLIAPDRCIFSRIILIVEIPIRIHKGGVANDGEAIALDAEPLGQ